MTTSKPSQEVHVVDVPDVQWMEAKFVYQYHVPDEGVNEEAGVPLHLLRKPGEYFDSSVTDYLSNARVPRYVKIEWAPVSYRDKFYGANVQQQTQLPKNYIRDNLSKVLSEEHFCSDEYSSINIDDQSIDQKLHSYISSSAHMLNRERNVAFAQRGMALKANEMTSNKVDYDFLSRYLIQPSEDGVFFYAKNSQRIKNDLVNKLKEFNVKLQLNNRIFHTATKRAINFPASTFNSSYNTLYEVSKKTQGRAISRGVRDLQADDYRTIAPEHVSLMESQSDIALSTTARVVGYIVDKYEILDSGEIKQLEPLVVDNVDSNTTLDLRVKYYSKYRYSLRSVAEFKVPSIVEDTGELVVATFLVASKPTVPSIVDCQELVPPPAPQDIKFVWDYDKDKLCITWSYPNTPQRDVKQFQVFRRRSVSEPFQLVKQFYFDDSAVQAPYNETPDPRLVEVDLTPRLYWCDDEFAKDSSYIYTLGSVDAHGMVSSYGPQTRVTFDRYSNKLKLNRISPEGAPRPYPNSSLYAEAFLDSIVESQKYKMQIAFQPEQLTVVDNSGRDLGFLKTDEVGGCYKFLIMNTDLGVSNTITVSVKNLQTKKSDELEAPTLKLPGYGNDIAKK